MDAPAVDYRAILDALPLAVFRLDSRGRVTYGNAQSLQPLGIDLETALGRTCEQLAMPRPIYERWSKCVQTALATGQPGQFEFLSYHHGPEQLVKYLVVPSLTEPAEPPGVIVIGMIIEELRQLRDALQEKDKLFDAFMDHSPFIAWMRDEPGRYVYVNQNYLKRYNLKAEDRLGRTFEEVWPPEVAIAFRANDLQVLATDQPMQVVEDAPEDSGQIRKWWNVKFPFTGSDGTRYVGGVGFDVTDRLKLEDAQRRAESKMARGQKLESLGLLAAGAAHDFNNLLTVIVGNAEVAQMTREIDPRVNNHLDQILEAAKQASELCRQMLAFAGQGPATSFRPTDLCACLRETMRLMRSLVPGTITVNLEIAKPLPVVMGDETQLRQVVMNLLTNAVEAIGEESGTITATLALETPTINPDDSDEAPLGPRLVLRFTDTGPGMSVETKSKIFDPFFTTKATGRGLGLAAVFGIVRAHKGTIAVESEPGTGTTFTVRLPATQ